MSPNQIAFYIGLFGSIHCIGMCGPLALAIPSFHSKWWMVIADKLVYNSGRVITYSFLGLLVGLLGKTLWMAGLQQTISIISGCLVIIAGISKLYKLRLGRGNLMAKTLAPINKLITYALQHKAGHLAVGMLNGLLPCGFVYLALIGAVNTTGPLAAAQYMFWFGAGTFPLMVLATISSGLIGQPVRRRINRAIPYFMVCLGFWFVLRGMALNIPYLSPAKQAAGIATCH